MPWIKITFAAGKDQLEIFSGRLESAGAQAVTIEDAGNDPLFDLLDGNHPVWDFNLVTGLFSDEQGEEAVLDQISHVFAPESLPEYRVESLPEKDWERSWMDRFQPMQYGRNLWICPTWLDPPDPDATNIMLDPGLAFGSGSHETTRLCMQWLSMQNLVGKTVIDFGCGSGILAIAALKLGATSAIGIDIDPQALQASRQNARLNRVSERLQLELPTNIPGQCEGDIVFANILIGTLIELKPQLLAMRNRHGVLVLSGVLKTQEALIYKAYEQDNILKVTSEGDWIMMSVTGDH